MPKQPRVQAHRPRGLRRLNARRWRGLFALLATLWLWPALAEADTGYGVVTLDLRPEGADVPTHLCVVSEGKGARTRDDLRDLLEPQAVAGAASPGTATTWRVKPSVWNADAASVDGQRCADDPGADCRPQIELPRGLGRNDTLYVACTADSLTEGSTAEDPRPLFVLLEYLEGSPPKIESVRLAGGIATIGVMGPRFDRVIVTARSLGGAYRPHGRSERGRIDDAARTSAEASGRSTSIQLALTPRCRMVELRLPRTRVKASDRDRLRVRINGIDLDPGRCVDNLVGSEVIRVRMPPAPLRVGSVDVELAATEDGAAAARFGGSFEGEWPRSPMSLDFNQVTFTWRRPDCIYPRDACPDATLETGTTCAATVTDAGCAYTCPGEFVTERALDLDLPLQVTFEKDDPNQRWTDTLAQNGQQLTSYVPADQVYLAANINDWETNVPDNKVTKIVLFGEDGAERAYGVTHLDRLLLRVPGAGLQGRGGTCESVRFKPAGDRAYDELVAAVEDGELVLGKPERGARLVSFNLTALLGGGPAWSGNLETPPIYFSGLAMFAVQVRPRRPNWNRVGFEMRAGGTLGSWGVPLVDDTSDADDPAMRPLDDDATASSASNDGGEARIGWARVLFEPGVVLSLHERIALGGGFGMGFSLPYRGADDITGDTLNFIVSPNLDLRFRLRRWLRLVVQFRGVFGEKEFERPAEDEGNQPQPGDRAQSLLILGGLQAQF